MNRKLKNVMIIFFLVCSIFAGLFISPLTDTAVAAWYDSEWNYRRIITIDHDFIQSNLTDFPLLVVVNSTIAQRCNDNGSDLIFRSLDNSTTFNYRVEGEWNQSGDNPVWINISETIPSTSDYQFYMYYNNSNATPSQNEVGTWDSNFIVVQHMNETTGQHLDSTSNNNDSTAISVFKQGNATGISDGCDDFESGNSDYVTMPDIGDLNTFTIEFWINVESLSATMEFIGKSGSFDGMVYLDGHTYFGMDVGGTCVGDAGDVDTGAWYYFVVTHDGTDIHAILGNTTAGTVLGKGSGTTASNLASDYQIGNRLNGAVPFDGLIDEFRISNVERSDSYINATYHAINQSTGFLTIGAESGPEDEVLLEPSSFIATTESNTQINLSWVQGINATHTRIQRKTSSYPISIADGTNIYNDTGTYHIDSSLTSYTAFYYSAWSFNSTTGNWSEAYSTATNHTGPANPTSIASTLSGSNANFTWTVGTRATQTVLTRKSTGYPSNADDGTKIYNGTNEYYVESITAGAYYRLFSYDNATELYSSGANADWGALTINCYDEETNDSLTFDVFISNQEGTQTYQNMSCTNPTYLDLNDLPLGESITIKISESSNYNDQTETFTGYDNEENQTITYVVLLREPKNKANTNVTCTNTTGGINSYPAFTLSDDVITILPDAANEFNQITVNYTYEMYMDRFYNRDFVANNYYVLDAYLPPTEETDVLLYKINVVGPQGEFTSPPVDDARLVFKRYLTFTGTYTTISSLHTDANGQVYVYLIPEEIYKVNISKDGYVTEIVDLIPVDSIYPSDREYTFRILPEEEEPTEYVSFWDTVTFTGTMMDAGYLSLGNITITYIDSNSTTTDTQIYLYETWNNTDTLVNITSNTSEQTISYTIGNINTSRLHYARLYFNNTANFDVDSPVKRIILAIHIYPRADGRSNLDTRIVNIIGAFKINDIKIQWPDIIAITIPIIILVLFGVFHTGIGIVGCGLSFGLMQVIYAINFTDSFNVLLILLCPVIIFIGAMHIWTKSRVEDII